MTSAQFIVRFNHGPQPSLAEANCFFTLSENSPWRALDAKAVEILRPPKDDVSSSSSSSSDPRSNLLRETIGYAGVRFLLEDDEGDNNQTNAMSSFSGGNTQSSSNIVVVAKAFGDALKLRDFDIVELKPCCFGNINPTGNRNMLNDLNRKYKASQVWIRAADPDDYEIVEAQQQWIELNLLRQINCIPGNKEFIFPVWIYDKTLVRLKVTKVVFGKNDKKTNKDNDDKRTSTSSPFAVLGLDTELVIETLDQERRAAFGGDGKVAESFVLRIARIRKNSENSTNSAAKDNKKKTAPAEKDQLLDNPTPNNLEWLKSQTNPASLCPKKLFVSKIAYYDIFAELPPKKETSKKAMPWASKPQKNTSTGPKHIWINSDVFKIICKSDENDEQARKSEILPWDCEISDFWNISEKNCQNRNMIVSYSLIEALKHENRLSIYAPELELRFNYRAGNRNLASTGNISLFKNSAILENFIGGKNTEVLKNALEKTFIDLLVDEKEVPIQNCAKIGFSSETGFILHVYSSADPKKSDQEAVPAPIPSTDDGSYVNINTEKNVLAESSKALSAKLRDSDSLSQTSLGDLYSDIESLYGDGGSSRAGSKESSKSVTNNSKIEKIEVEQAIEVTPDIQPEATPDESVTKEPIEVVEKIDDVENAAASAILSSPVAASTAKPLKPWEIGKKKKKPWEKAEKPSDAANVEEKSPAEKQGEKPLVKNELIENSKESGINEQKNPDNTLSEKSTAGGDTDLSDDEFEIQGFVDMDIYGDHEKKLSSESENVGLTTESPENFNFDEDARPDLILVCPREASGETENQEIHKIHEKPRFIPAERIEVSFPSLQINFPNLIPEKNAIDRKSGQVQSELEQRSKNFMYIALRDLARVKVTVTLVSDLEDGLWNRSLENSIEDIDDEEITIDANTAVKTTSQNTLSDNSQETKSCNPNLDRVLQSPILERIFHVDREKDADARQILLESVEWIVSNEQGRVNNIQNSTTNNAITDLGYFSAPKRKIQDNIARQLRGFFSTKQDNKSQNPPPTSFLLVGGDRGSFKHEVLKNSIAFESGPTIWVKCALLANPNHKFSDVIKVINALFRIALLAGPAVLVLEEFDTLVFNANAQPSQSVGEERSRFFIEHFREIFVSRFFQENIGSIGNNVIDKDNNSSRILQKLAIVATVTATTSEEAVQQPLAGAGLFDESVFFAPASMTERADILAHLFRCERGKLEKLFSNNSDLSAAFPDDSFVKEVAAKTDGFSIQDMKNLVNVGIDENYDKSRKIDINTQADTSKKLKKFYASFVETTLKTFTPASRAEKKFLESDIKWEHLGALEEVKNTLIETLLLPTTFEPLYSRAPIRLRQGLILTGPPGSGKSLIVQAACNKLQGLIRFLSVKGPELLSKYIGESEANVRKVFAAAKNAAPACIFFDELEALCPVRGADSTGVTDRVVNQMLTYLDGVEARKSLFVLAASSRPDLVDPALLRPGRLDRRLDCGFVDTEHDVVSIAKAVCLRNKLVLDECAEGFIEIGRKGSSSSSDNSKTSESFAAKFLKLGNNMVGADVDAIFSTAQLEAIHDKLGDDDNLKEDNSATKEENSAIKITKKHLQSALSQTKPCVPDKTAMIYRPGGSKKKGGTKVALA